MDKTACLPEDQIFVMNGRALDYPAALTYDQLTPVQIKALCELDMPSNRMFCSMPSWEKAAPSHRLFYRLKAYWALRGAKDPGTAASIHSRFVSLPDFDWYAECKAYGWGTFFPRNLSDLEKEFLPAVIPNAYLIFDRCPQMAMIHALRGNVSEPYWWATLSITEHATPNLSRECSDGYAGFSDGELAERVARIHREDTKPALCSRLDGVNRNVCGLCRFKEVVRSPIALGYSHEPKNKKVTP